VAELNALPAVAAHHELSSCCGSSRWAAAITARRPFRDLREVCSAADEIWFGLEGGDWLEAFAHHPRIGERATGWAGDEQSGTRGAAPETLQTLGRLNHEYERKFGHVFLISAAGKSAAEMLAELQRRIDNDPASELRVAASEQARITRLRLEKLLAASREASAR